MKKYIIGSEEKKYIKEFLSYETRFNLNFLLSSVEDNLILIDNESNLIDVFRDASYYKDLAISLYKSIYKQTLNEKIEIDKIYIPISSYEYNILKSKNKNSGFLLGTIQKFVAEAKPYPEIEDLIILEANLKNISLFKLDQNFEDSSLVIIGPSFKIKELDEKYEVDEEFLEKKEIQKRKFKKVEIEFVPNKSKEVKEQELDVIAANGGNISEDIENYLEILSWTKKLEEALALEDEEKLLNLGISSDEEGYDEEYEEDEQDSIQKQDKSKDITDKAMEDLEEIKKEIEEKAEDIKKRLNILIDKTNYTEEGKPGEKILKLKEEYSEKNNENSKIPKEVKNEIFENAAKQIDLNYLEIHDIVEDIEEWKDKIIKGLNFEYLKSITKIESEKNKYFKSANFTKEEKKLYTEIFDSMKYNIEKTEELLEETEDLIKAQQKFAKIAAETSAKYSSVIDGFGIRNEAFKLKEILKKTYQNFEEKYYLRITQNEEEEKVEEEKTKKTKNNKNKKHKHKEKDKNKEKIEIKDIDLKRKQMRISTSELKNILETSKQITAFLNMLFNPKIAKPKTKINRFEELILIEENELKRKIFKYTKYLINEGNLDILEDEIEIIEKKSAIKKILDLISGKHKIESYYIERLEETIDKIIELSEKDLKIDRNYRIHDIIAEIMMFKSDNTGDELLDEIINKLSKLEIAIAKNFEINESKVLDVINEKKNVAFPVQDKITKKDEIDIEIESLMRKYEYVESAFVDEAIYEDSTKNEIKKIVDYAKISEG